LKVWTAGLKAFQIIGKFVKPTTRLIQVFGWNANKSILEIREDDLIRLIKGEPVSYSVSLDNGYVILSFNGAILGLGLYIEGQVRSQIPRRDLIQFI
jgi:NOL1/NOP2/fmu family ribosome biogenesis protein